MSLTLNAPSRAGSIGRGARGWSSIALAFLVVLLVVSSGMALLVAEPRSLAPTPGTSGLTPAAGPPFTHGDLNVTSGQVFVIQPTPGSHTYYQGGNITVFSGGTLIVRNVTLSFVQFVSDNGTAAQRLSHIYRFIDQAGGKVEFFNSTLTTDVAVINAYAKLNFSVAGAVTAVNSTFAFPGWLGVNGAQASLTLNRSSVTANPAVKNLGEPPIILGDTLYAPSITVTGGAQFNAFASYINDTYADNTKTNGQVATAPLSVSNGSLSGATTTFSPLSTPTDSANLTQDWLYPQAQFAAGDAVVEYKNANLTLNGTATLNVLYEGVTYQVVASIIFVKGTQTTLVLPLPATLVAAVTASGVLNYLNNTGDFGVVPLHYTSIQFTNYAGAPAGSVTIVLAEIYFLPTPQYNVIVAGTGTTLNSIDSSFDVNWNQQPLSPISQNVPFPWDSNKLLLADGAKGYFANVTVQTTIPGVFSYSAILPDTTAQAIFYRWAQFNLTGLDGALAVINANVSAYYAYTSSQANNRTTNALNNLSTANPQIWGYVEYWDSQHGVTNYGHSNIAGVAWRLLASSNLTGSSLPDGYFLGGYHIGISVPAYGVSPHWFNWSVSPYPEGIGIASPGHASPDFAPAQQFNQYYGAAMISAVLVTANGVTSKNVNLGQVVGVRVTVEDIGSVPITQVSGGLYYNFSTPFGAPLNAVNLTGLDLAIPGQTLNFTLTWKATLNVTGINALFSHDLTIGLSWNDNNHHLGGGNLSENVSLKFAPTVVNVSLQFLANGAPASSVDLGQTLGAALDLSNVGNGTITGLDAYLYYNATTLLASYTNSSLFLHTPGQHLNVTLNWLSTENVTGLHGWFLHNFTIVVDWDLNNLWLGSGNVSPVQQTQIAPSLIRISVFNPPPTTLSLSQQYLSTGTVVYNGSHAVSFFLNATPVGAAPSASVTIAEITEVPSATGNFELPWTADLGAFLTAGTTYKLTAAAEYNGRWTQNTLPGTYSVPPPSSSAVSFLYQTFLGLPIWLWIAIAAAAVVGIVLFLFFARRQAAGKLVECGECGNLIPEDATVCPKCGAEFEKDLIRCSRCASTIPADSKFCPECAAQLLGAPGEGASDPEKQAYADFTEKYRAEAKRELGDNYSEGAFWDWWKRQPTYTPFSQWSLQQGQGTPRIGMTAPPTGTETTETAGGAPPKGGAGAAAAPTTSTTSASVSPPPASPATVPPPAPGGAGLKPCPSCGKEIPAEYLVCPFCNAVTQ